MKRSFTHFILRCLLAALPVAGLIMAYVVADPFRVIWPADDAIAQWGDSLQVNINQGHVSAMNFKRYNCERHYDSFIMGSSMSQNYKASDWAAHLPAGASIYHFDAWRETLQGISDKLDFLEKQGTTVNNVLIVIEEEMLHRDADVNDFRFMGSPITSPDVGTLDFHWRFFKNCLSMDVIRFFLDPQGHASQAVSQGIVTRDVPSRIPELNESYYAQFDSLIAVSPDAFFTPERLAQREIRAVPTVDGPQMHGLREQQARHLAEQLHRLGAHYIILVPPRYGRPTLCAYDRVVLAEIFGSDHVFDFSDHPTMSTDPRCFYDRDAHLISRCCKQLLDSCYSTSISLHSR